MPKTPRRCVTINLPIQSPLLAAATKYATENDNLSLSVAIRELGDKLVFSESELRTELNRERERHRGTTADMNGMTRALSHSRDVISAQQGVIDAQQTEIAALRAELDTLRAADTARARAEAECHAVELAALAQRSIDKRITEIALELMAERVAQIRTRSVDTPDEEV